MKTLRTIRIELAFDVDPGVFDIDAYYQSANEVVDYAAEVFVKDGCTVSASI